MFSCILSPVQHSSSQMNSTKESTDKLTQSLTGGCLCRKVQYRVTGLPFDADFCHCRHCQKSTGSVVGAWMDFKREQVAWLTEPPTEYASSEHVRRGFCPHCGSQLSFRDLRYEQYLTLSISTLNEPNAIKPNYHIYTDSQLEWFNIQDNCPRYDKNRG